MFLIIGRFIKGIILGWIMSLIFYLVKRALARAFGNVQQSQQSSRTHADPYQQSSSTGHDVVETIWAGINCEPHSAHPTPNKIFKAGKFGSMPI
jgi:hypothetical protein